MQGVPRITHRPTLQQNRASQYALQQPPGPLACPVNKPQEDKLNNAVLFDKQTYEKLLAEAPKYKMITPSILADRLRINGSLARAAVVELEEKGLIRPLVKHASQSVYTRATGA
eukprot:363862-Chlamydomonas_euryale.AAC.4